MWNNQRAFSQHRSNQRTELAAVMTQKMTSASTGKKGAGVLRAIGDLLILLLLLAAAGGGGYLWGTHQQLAPVEKVGVGTPGASKSSQLTPLPPPKTEAASTTTKPTKSSETAASEAPAAEEKSTGSKKYWISSSGADYTGYSITVKVNDNVVDNFFGPGKNVDITRLVKGGDNEIVFDAKNLGDQYNKHTGDANSVLTVQVVSGPHVTDSFKNSDVVTSYSRTAAQTDDASATKKFTKE